MDYPKKMIARFTPRRYMFISGISEHQLYMKMYCKKYREDNIESMNKYNKEYYNKTKVLKTTTDI